MKQLVFVMIAMLTFSCGRNVDTATSDNDTEIENGTFGFVVNAPTQDGWKVTYDITASNSMDTHEKDELSEFLADETKSGNTITLYEDRSYLDIIWSSYPVTKIDVTFEDNFITAYEKLQSAEKELLFFHESYTRLVQSQVLEDNNSDPELDGEIARIKEQLDSMQTVVEGLMDEVTPTPPEKQDGLDDPAKQSALGDEPPKIQSPEDPQK